MLLSADNTNNREVQKRRVFNRLLSFLKFMAKLIGFAYSQKTGQEQSLNGECS